MADDRRCQVFGCRFQVNTGAFCKMHECPKCGGLAGQCDDFCELCEHPVVSGGKFCVYHSCFYERKCTNRSGECLEHPSCILPGCREKSFRLSGFCVGHLGHRCLYCGQLKTTCGCLCNCSGCNYRKLPGGTYCELHSCDKCLDYNKFECPEHGCPAITPFGKCCGELMAGKFFCRGHQCQGEGCYLTKEDCAEHTCEYGNRCPFVKEPGSLFCTYHKCRHCNLQISKWSPQVCDAHRCKYRGMRRGKIRGCHYADGKLPDGQHCANHVQERRPHPCQCATCQDPAFKSADKT